MGSTTPSVAGFRNLLECQLVARGPVSASPSPTTQATIRLGLSNAAPYACETAYPSSPPSCIEPGVSGATWLGMPPGNENCVKRRFIPSSSCEMCGYTSLYVCSRYAVAHIPGPPGPGPAM